mmetsp:Transcript_47291/g.103142  ORF Transcript_47291/g.103142 Transcript_47291/m.103142 type:complete len:119 (-) Transcript_47291:276-632(-)
MRYFVSSAIAARMAKGAMIGLKLKPDKENIFPRESFGGLGKPGTDGSFNFGIFGKPGMSGRNSPLRSGIFKLPATLITFFMVFKSSLIALINALMRPKSTTAKVTAAAMTLNTVNIEM